MTRRSGLKFVNKFQKGLITEATGLNFPEDAAVDALNVVFTNKASVHRRKGFSLESDYSYASVASTSNSVINEFLWRGASGQADINIAVVQIGAKLYFWLISTSQSLSSGYQTQSIDLGTYKVSGAPDISTVACQFATGANYLFVVHSYCTPFFVSFDSDTNLFSSTAINIKIRDFEGLTETTATDERPSTLTNTHRYNLKNQGWYPDVVNVSDTGTTNREPVDYFRLAIGYYPSNSDIWWQYKDSFDAFNPSQFVTKQILGNANAPKGHYILDPFYMDRSTASGITGIPVVSSGYERPSSVAFFAGRVFFAGVQRNKFSSNIYFSNIIQSDSDIPKCYQVNDPTIEGVNDLLSTDGGVIKIPEMSLVIKMIPVWNSLIVFATNGVWAISGSSNDSFKATDYNIKKLSAIQSIGASTFVNIEGMAIWMNQTGIYNVQPNQYGDLVVDSVTDDTIKTFITNIPASSKKYAKCTYDSNTRVIQWLYRSTEETDISNRYSYDSILNLNLITGAFYPYSLSGLTLSGLLAIEGLGSITNIEAVQVGSVAVQASSNPVVVTERTSSYFSSLIKYLYINSSDTTKVSWLEENDPSYQDMGTIPYPSYFTSTYNVDGQATTNIQLNYAFVFMEEIEGSSCFVSASFNWANTAYSNKITNNQQGYMASPDGTSVKIKRLKIRGSGRAVVMKFASDGNNPFSIIGWSLAESGNTTP